MTRTHICATIVTTFEGDILFMKLTEKTIIDNIEDRNINNLSIQAFESLGGSTIDYKTFFEYVNNYAKAW